MTLKQKVPQAGTLRTGATGLEPATSGVTGRSGLDRAGTARNKKLAPAAQACPSCTLWTRTVGTSGACYDVAWSPDDKRLVFARYTFRGKSEDENLFVVSMDGTGLRRLTPTPDASERFPT